MLEFRRKLLEIRIYRPGESEEEVIYIDRLERTSQSNYSSIVSLVGGIPTDIENIIEDMAKDCEVKVEITAVCYVSKVEEVDKNADNAD